MMISVSDLLLGLLVLAVGWFLARGGGTLARVLIFASALIVSALLFLPGPQITGAVGPEGIGLLRRLAAHTPWNASEWVHFLIFLWLGLLLWLGRPDLRNWKGWALIVVLAVAAELAQDLAPGRSPRVDDVLLNLAGGMVGILLGIGVRKLWGKNSAGSDAGQREAGPGQQGVLRNYSTRLLAGGAGDPEIAAEDLAAHADEQGIAGLLLDLPVLAEPELMHQRKAIQAVARQGAVREMARLAETRRILAMFDAAGIELLVLKGSALAYWLYREPWQRTRCDLDVLVRDKQAARRAVEMLGAEGYRLISGMSPDDSTGFEVALQRDAGVVIDLHWRLLNTASLERHFSYAELDSQAIPLPGLHPGARGLGRQHALFHALLHRITNLAKGDGDRLIWLYDIHLLAGGQDEAQWRDFLTVCGEKRIATLCLDGLRASREALGTTVPDAVDAELSSLAESESWQLEGLDQGVVDRSHLGTLPWRQKIAWLRRKLFPSAEFMRHRYDVTGAGSLAKAYVRRWRIGLSRAFGRRIN